MNARLHDLSVRIACAVKAYRTAMQYKPTPGQTPREVAKAQVAIFFDTVEREYLNAPPPQKHEYYHREF